MSSCTRGALLVFKAILSYIEMENSNWTSLKPAVGFILEGIQDLLQDHWAALG